MTKPLRPTVYDGMSYNRFRAKVFDRTDNWGRTTDFAQLAQEMGATYEKGVWTPDLARPRWIDASPSMLMMARDLLARDQPLTNLSPRDFEKLIGEMLERDGWEVTVMRGTKDGGIDVEACKGLDRAGIVRTIWQAKRFG